MTIFLVDSHCHLDFPDFETERPALVERAKAAGVGLMVTISTYVTKVERLTAITDQFAEVYSSIGTHPHNAAAEPEASVAELVALSRAEKCVAIGEAGLDYHYDKAPRDVQARVFRNHIAAARETQLPLVIHARDADEDMRRILEEESGKGAFPFLLHCFSSGRDLARTGLDLGGTLSFSGILTFKTSQTIRDVAAAAPLDRILVETDAPYLAPPPHRGKRNEPAYVRQTAQVLADVRGVDLTAIAEATSDNFFRLFSKVPDPRRAASAA
ncbi:TatD family hydrolase [Aurantimonas sp. Leaf443]|uniref:TatD family hydrolase n=1 Tax=Aurantimonas sp. Leaf443 TaxID=1736378 RepID=UPI0006F633DD|nr:TatD family hydrolase [Aurantimonas sp. Leaf443]KQT83481.1 LuxR family transcriptional regulator [Aurantimonas sp. Leaf443]